MGASTNVQVFPVVIRIRDEINFCFSAFYGNLIDDKNVCDLEFEEWLKSGNRGPGQLAKYIRKLSLHLDTATQRSIFVNLAEDAITLKRKVNLSEANSSGQSGTSRNLLVAAFVLVLAAAIYFIAKLNIL